MSLTILDIAVILIFLFFIFNGARNGIAKSIFSLIGTTIAIIITAYISGITTDFVYTHFVKEGLRASLKSAISSGGGVESIFKVLPNFVINALKIYDITEEKIYSSLERGSSAVQADIAVNIISPAVTGVINAILTILIFIILFFFIGNITRKISYMFKVPVLRQIDGFFGAVFGFIKSYIFVAIFAILARLALPMMDSPPDFFSPSAIEASEVFGHFYKNDFIHEITQKIGLI